LIGTSPRLKPAKMDDAQVSLATTASEAMRLVAEGEKAVSAFKKKVPSYRRQLRDWSFYADKRQLPPTGDWHCWLMLAGRGFGKTRAGAEWVHSLVENEGAIRIALVGATMDEARAIMVEGSSGLLNTRSAADRPKWEPSRGRLSWRNGAEAFLYSGEKPDKLRGPDHHYAWCDELAKWAWPLGTWDNLQLGLRKGDHPRALITTTPRPIGLLRKLITQDRVVTVRGRMEDNPYLPDAFRDRMRTEHGGTRFGRQELDGELIDDPQGALWTRDILEGCRVPHAPMVKRTIIGVDPPAGIGRDACGIVVVGLGVDDKAYVLADCTVHGATPEGWARAVVSAADVWQADRVVAESNQGGAMVGATLRAVEGNLPIKLVHATHGKIARAEPVQALYSSGKAHHVGALPALEDELCGMIIGGGYEGPGRSPDRADALVWAMTEVMLGKARAEPRVRVF
jgi:phage terminase large subunit-like protein